MPGIVTSRHLQEAIVDSVFPNEATLVRLMERRLPDPRRAYDLRVAESAIFRDMYPNLVAHLKGHLSIMVRDRSVTGNTSVYTVMSSLLPFFRHKKVIKGFRENHSVIAMEYLSDFMAYKLTPDDHMMMTRSMPEGYTRVSSRAISMRSFISALNTGFTGAGRHRGRFQVAARKNNPFRSLQERLLDSIANTGIETLFREKVVNREGYKVDIFRVSDLIVLWVDTPRETGFYPMTRVHLERLIDTVRSVSNCLLTIFMSYAFNDARMANTASETFEEYVRQLMKMGIKDSLLPGEAGKAASDIIKAKLSQSAELPFNNVQLLKRTYDSKRLDAAEELVAVLLDTKMDIDIVVNLSYAWKLALQPDSDISQDFKELADALMKPNPIKEGTTQALMCTMKRSVLVTALREGRQPEVEAYPGNVVPEEVTRAIRANAPTENMLRLITAGSMAGLKITVGDVYPDVHDTRHLTFKDKSSTVTDEKLGRKVADWASVVLEVNQLEDKVILEVAEANTDTFLRALNDIKGVDRVDKALKITTNDIVTSIDESVRTVFMEAEKKFDAIIKTLAPVEGSYETDKFFNELRAWAEENPDLVINTSVEPKLGEVHKRVVRIFYMFEKGMKTFLSQFERIARILDYSIKGAEIVKGDRAREKHMNILSSAYRASLSGTLAYEILFDLSKFSQKFNHRLIDAASTLIAELTGYPAYGKISYLFKASLLILAARFSYGTHLGVAGAFEGFLNFLWTGIHATVMDIALKECGRSGDLAAYSDDGLLLFTLAASLMDPEETARKELVEIVSSIQGTYKDYGLDFNLGKTLISRVFSEFLGQLMYKGKRIPTWMKETIQLGRRDSEKVIYPTFQSVNDISSQMRSMIKAGVPIHAAYYVGGYEILSGPGRHIRSMAIQATRDARVRRPESVIRTLVMAYLILPAAWGGARVPDAISASITADTNQLSEAVYEVCLARKYDDNFGAIADMMCQMVHPTNEYGALLRNGTSVHTKGIGYGAFTLTNRVISMLGRDGHATYADPFLRKNAVRIHEVLESYVNLDPTWVALMGSCSVAEIERSKRLAPEKSSALRRLLTRSQIRRLQREDTSQTTRILKTYALHIKEGSARLVPDPDSLLQRSYPNLRLAPTLPAHRAMVYRNSVEGEYYYNIQVDPHVGPDTRGSKRLSTMQYSDELAPPLVSTDVSSAYLSKAPDLLSHVTRQLYTYLISASSSGSDLSALVDAIADHNGTPLTPVPFLTSLGDLRKLAVANRKKAIHRVYWSMHVNAQSTMTRSGRLNELLTAIPNVHYSMLVTLALANATSYVNLMKATVEQFRVIVEVDPRLAVRLVLHRMEPCARGDPRYIPPAANILRSQQVALQKSVYNALKNEARRAIANAQEDLKTNILAGRISMVADVRSLNTQPDAADPLKSAIMWTIIRRLDNVVSSEGGTSGVVTMQATMAAVEGVPSYLVDYAMIYRAAKTARKGAIAKFAAGDLAESPITWEDADATVYAAEQLGLTFSVDAYELQSKKSACIYLSILAGDEIGLVYCALEPHAESSDSPIISSARARALGRSMEAVVAQLFKGKDHSPEGDLDKIGLMILRSCVRGSVHRSQPYNPRVAIDWIYTYLMAIASVIQHPADPEHLEHYDIDDAVIDAARQRMPAWGDVSQFIEVSKFIANLYNWKVLPKLFNYLSNECPPPLALAQALQTSLFERFVRPVLATVKTISYGTVTHTIKQLNMSGDLLKPYKDYLEEIMEEVLNDVRDDDTDALGYDFARLMDKGVNATYRDTDTALADLGVNIITAGLPPDLSRSALAFSYALPFMLTSGITGFRTVRDYSQYDFNRSVDLLTETLSSYTIPRDIGQAAYDLHIIQNLSEADILLALQSIPDRTLYRSVLVIEIPPNASTWSIGLIGLMTQARRSLVTVGLSSDFAGMSLYVCAILDAMPSQIREVKIRREVMGCSLGDLCMQNVLDNAPQELASLVSAIATAPLMQAGIPATTYINQGGITVPVPVTEELMDRSILSFIEAPRTSDSTVNVASMSNVLLAYAIRVAKVRASQTPAVTSLLACGAYALVIQTAKENAQGYLDTLRAAFDGLDDEQEKITLLQVIRDMISDLPAINPAALPVTAQMLEVDVPDISMPSIRLSRRIRRAADTELRAMNRIPDFVRDGNPLVEAINGDSRMVTKETIMGCVQEVSEEDSSEEEEGGGISYAYRDDRPFEAGRSVTLPERRAIAYTPSTAEQHTKSIASWEVGESSTARSREPDPIDPFEMGPIIRDPTADYDDIKDAIESRVKKLTDPLGLPDEEVTLILTYLAENPHVTLPEDDDDALDAVLDYASEQRAKKLSGPPPGVQ